MPDIATPNWGFSNVIPITSSVSAVLGFPWGVRRILRIQVYEQDRKAIVRCLKRL
jgi:hypothetical protein